MDKDRFKRNIIGLIQMKNLAVDEGYVQDLYTTIKNDFSDEQFEHACQEVLKHEGLYNKQPDPQLFYKYKKGTEGYGKLFSMTSEEKAEYFKGLAEKEHVVGFTPKLMLEKKG